MLKSIVLQNIVIIMIFVRTQKGNCKRLFIKKLVKPLEEVYGGLTVCGGRKKNYEHITKIISTK